MPGITALIASLIALAMAAPAAAHEGPPYAIVVDRDVGPFRLSLWGDPDVGTGTFFVHLEPRARGGAFPAASAVRIYVQPADRRIAERGYDAEREQARGHEQRFVGRVPFETEETWRVRLAIESAEGRGEVETEVEVTPPGQGPVLDFILYLFPFVAVGGLVVLAMVRRRRRVGPELHALFLLLVIAGAGCTPEEAAPFGKFLFGFMAVALTVIPIAFALAWRRRRRRR